MMMRVLISIKTKRKKVKVFLARVKQKRLSLQPLLKRKVRTITFFENIEKQVE